MDAPEVGVRHVEAAVVGVCVEAERRRPGDLHALGERLADVVRAHVVVREEAVVAHAEARGLGDVPEVSAAPFEGAVHRGDVRIARQEVVVVGDAGILRAPVRHRWERHVDAAILPLPVVRMVAPSRVELGNLLFGHVRGGARGGAPLPAVAGRRLPCRRSGRTP